MADDPIDSFLVEIGFKKPDAAGARAAVDAVDKAETAITEVQAREGTKRTTAETKAQADAVKRATQWLAQRKEAEEKAQEERVAATAELFSDMLGLDKEHTAELLKRAKVGSAKSVEVERDRAKKLSQIHAGQFKEAEVGLLRFAGFLNALGTGLSSALSAAPFGAFVMGIERGAAGLSRLDIQAKRVGSSAAGIQRFLFAMKQQGVDEGEASGALEGFASTMKSNPEGYRQALERLPGGGVRTLGKDGKPLDYDGMLENFEGYLAKQPFNIARIQAGQFGITGDNAVAALQDPAATRKGLAAFDAKLGAFGFDPNKAAEDARKVQQSWDNLEADFKVIKQKLDAEFFLPFMTSLDALAKKLEENPQAVENFGRGLEAMAVALSARVLPVLTNLGVKLAGLAPVLGSGLGTAVGIAVNPVVALGASAESTPGKGVSADPVEREAEAAENKRLTDEANVKLGQGKGFWKDVWTYAKQKLGMENALPAGDPQVKQAILDTAEATKKLADATSLSGTPGGDVGGGGSFGSPSDTGAHGVGGANLRYGQNESGNYRRGGHGGGGRNYADTPEGHGNAGAVKGSERDRIASAMKHLVEVKGWTPEGAAIAIGNAMQESNVTPNGRPGDPNTPGGSHYMFQWNNGRNNDTVNGRRARYERWMRENNRDPNDFHSPLDFMDEERKNRSGLEAQWHTQKDFRNAGRLGHLFEGYGDSSEGTRVQNARDALVIYKATRGGTATAQASVPAGTSAKAISDAEVFAARQRILNGSRNPADRALVERYKTEQGTPTGDLSHVRPGISADADHPVQERTLGRYINTTRPMAAAGTLPHPHAFGPARVLEPDAVAKVEVVKSNLNAAHQKLADAMRAAAAPGAGHVLDPAQQKLADAMNADIKRKADQHALNMRIVEAAKNGHLVPFLRHPLGMTPALRSSIDNSTRSHHFERHGDTFNIHGGDAKSGLDQATKVSARREGQDRIRYGQG